jgi:CheY-like chemotaxis protein
MRRILIADDNAVSRELLRHILKDACDEIVEASEGRETLQKVADARPDLVLLDLEMPRLDGYAVLRRLREDPRLAATRVVAVTARAMQGDREQAVAAGFDGYITKPINAVEVRRCVERLSGKRIDAASGVETP